MQLRRLYRLSIVSAFADAFFYFLLHISFSPLSEILSLCGQRKVSKRKAIPANREQFSYFSCARGGLLMGLPCPTTDARHPWLAPSGASCAQLKYENAIRREVRSKSQPQLLVLISIIGVRTQILLILKEAMF